MIVIRIFATSSNILTLSTVIIMFIADAGILIVVIVFMNQLISLMNKLNGFMYYGESINLVIANSQMVFHC